MNKKAVDLTINTVVVAILAVLVLVVLFYVFTGKVGLFSKELNTCPSGNCIPTSECALKGFPLPGEYLDSAMNSKCSNLKTGAGEQLVCCSAR